MLGVRRQPGGNPSPAPRAGRTGALRSELLVRGKAPGRTRNRPRRSRRSCTRRGLRPPRHLVPVPRCHGTDFRPLPQTGSDQARADVDVLGDRRARTTNPRRCAPARLRRRARRGPRRLPPRASRALPPHTGRPCGRRGMEEATSLRRGLGGPAGAPHSPVCMERCEAVYRLENRRCDRSATHDVRGSDGHYYLVCEHHAHEHAGASVAQWSGQSDIRRSTPIGLTPATQ
jgi:hypothetical protein